MSFSRWLLGTEYTEQALRGGICSEGVGIEEWRWAEFCVLVPRE